MEENIRCRDYLMAKTPAVDAWPADLAACEKTLDSSWDFLLGGLTAGAVCLACGLALKGALRAAYGEGYRSPQARTLDDGEDAR